MASKNPPGNNQVSDKPRCGAQLDNGKTCRRFPIQFGTRCPRHGGALPNVKAAAEARRITLEVGRAMERMGRPKPVENPLLELQQLAGEVLQWKTVCREHLHDLKDMGYASMTGEQVHAKVLVWERALDRSITALAALARLNIDERLARIEEQQAEMVRSAFAAALEDLGLGVEQRAGVAKTFAAHLRLIEGAA